MKSSPTRKQKLHVKPIHKVPAAHLPRPVAAGPSLPSLSLATGNTKVLRHVTETRNIHTEPREVMGLHGVFFLSFCSTSSSQCHRCAGSGSCAGEEMQKPLGTQLLPPQECGTGKKSHQNRSHVEYEVLKLRAWSHKYIRARLSGFTLFHIPLHLMNTSPGFNEWPQIHGLTCHRTSIILFY